MLFWLATIFSGNFPHSTRAFDIYDKSVTSRQENFKLEKFTLTLMSLERAVSNSTSNLNNAFQYYIPILLIANNNKTQVTPVYSHIPQRNLQFFTTTFDTNCKCYLWYNIEWIRKYLTSLFNDALEAAFFQKGVLTTFWPCNNFFLFSVQS